MEKKSSFVGGAAILAAAGLIVRIIGAVYRIPLANIVGVDGMRYYQIVYPYYSALLVISSSGLPTAISKMVSERVTLGDYRGARAVFRTAFRLLCVIGVVTALFMLLGADLLAGLSYPDSAQEEVAKQALAFRAMSPALLFVSLLCAYRGYLQGMQLMTGTALSQIVEQVGKLAVGFTLASYLLERGPEYAAMGALIGVSASELLALISIFIVYRRRKPQLDERIKRAPKMQKGWNFSSISKRLMAIAIPVTIGASVMPLTGIVDSAMIINTLESIGYSVEQAGEAYSLLSANVTPLVNMPAVLTVALAMSLVPAISSYMAKKEYRQVQNAARTGLKLSLIIGTPCAVGLFVMAEPILKMLYTSLNQTQLTLAAGLLQTACIGVVFLSLVQTLTGVIQGLGKPNVPVLNLMFGGILKVVSLAILTRRPEINIQGAAVSTVVCYATAAILDCIYLVRKTNMKLNVLDVFVKPVFASALMGISVHFLYKAFMSAELSSTVATLAAVMVGVLVYGACIVVLRMFSKADLAFIPGGHKLLRFAKQ
ncbi:polysaccharide biosynthesis protein [Eubacteriales bacterium OttesenSCG-928-K08]|nr:polysaccharide biosynthesis protein [Eubacteriales bacterium OttesenSCG-928-K08]